MVDDGTVLRVIDDLHWNELSAEWENIQVCIEGLVLLQNLWVREGRGGEGRGGEGRGGEGRGGEGRGGEGNGVESVNE